MAPGSVLQVVTSAERRGAETFAVALGDELTARGWTIRTVALHRGGGGLDLPVLGAKPLAFDTLAQLRSAARGHDLVIAHGSSTLPACATALAASSTPFVYRNIGDPTHWGSTAARRLRTALALTRAQTVVALTPAAGEAMERLYRVRKRRIVVIPSGVSKHGHRPVSTEERRAVRTGLGLPDEATVAAVVAALSPEKGVDVAIDAVADLDGFHLVVAGDGPERAALEAQARARAPGRVHFLGALDDPGAAYAAADLFVLPSRTEGLPAALIEAGMRRLPSAATDVGYVKDIVIDGVTGALASTSSSPELTRAMERAMSLGPAAGEAARTRCLAQFEMATIAEQWDELLQRVMRN
jgi:glycosyltransferase involved in cell wall biosynthesis